MFQPRMLRAGGLWAVLALCLPARAQDKAAPPDSAPAAEARVPLLSDVKTWELLPEAEVGGGGPLPAWARALAGSLPRTTAVMLELEWRQRAASPLDSKLTGKLRWTVARANRCEYTAAYALADLADRAAQGDTNRVAVKAADWPWWRGRTRDGVADADQKPPRRWSETQNVVWKTAVPGRGHASPTVVGDRVFLPTADKARETRSVLCYDRATGREVWKRDVHTGGFDQRGNEKSSQASATIACDGERVFANFLDDGEMVTTALDLDGEQLWQTRVCEFATHQGFGSSPAVYESLVIVVADSKAGGVVAALDRRDGKIVWSYDRPKQPNYTSPAILRVDGRDQLLLAGCDHVTSLDPSNGEKRWEIEGSTTECVGSIVSDGKLVFASGGYPKKLTLAVQADGSGKVVWQNDVQTYVPSMLVTQGHLYTVTDGGVAMCWNATTGKEAWKARLGGTFNASLVLVGDQILATNQEGHTFIFKADPTKFQLIAENQLGDDVYATPVVCGDRIYMRVAKREGEKRQEWLYSIGSGGE